MQKLSSEITVGGGSGIVMGKWKGYINETIIKKNVMV